MTIIKIENLKDWKKRIDHKLHALCSQLKEVITDTEEYYKINREIERQKITKEAIDSEIEKEEIKFENKINGKSS